MKNIRFCSIFPCNACKSDEKAYKKIPVVATYKISIATDYEHQRSTYERKAILNNKSQSLKVLYNKYVCFIITYTLSAPFVYDTSTSSNNISVYARKL